MWGRHYWGGGRRPDPAAAGVVVMFAWLSSQERHVRAYVELYAARGWACLVCHSDFPTLFFPEKAAMLADRVLGELVKELKIRPVPVAFASFSGGPKGCTYKVLQLIERRCKGQLSLDEYQLVRDCLCGQMYDSSPVDFVSDLGTRFLLDPSVLKMSEPPRVLSWMAKGVASGLDALFINKFEEQRKDYWETLYSSVNVGPILILCSEDDQLAPYSVVENFAKRLLELGGDVNLVKWHSSPHVGHYKYHPEEYRTAVTELLMKASALYMSRRQLNGYEVGTSEHSDMPPSISDQRRTAASSNNRLRRAPIDPMDQFFLPSSMEYHESSEGPKPELFNMPSVESLSLHGVLGQVMYDVCVPKNVEGWDLKPSASRHMHTAARRHSSFNPMKCVRRSRL
ncbi:hypothetical protein SETIT_8G193000v2 [Setaria italica]|uniref:DUF829 domain-containing protein n=1 Tax=Setaria italica TaxID=4555 RepID=K3ZIR3_SETIT|nr:uncharacterized protein LOC101759281 [Setaria italica]RCV39058.1 hypothetical protein SETIT_8G193000v2 [Setaria italica]